MAGLVMDVAGNLYGTTQDGGSGSGCSFGCGTVFKLDPAGNFTVLHSFTGSPDDGGRPVAGLIMDTAGNLYGTTEEGGSGTCTVISGIPVSGCGTVFKLDPAGNETVLHSFTGGSDGRVAIRRRYLLDKEPTSKLSAEPRLGTRGLLPRQPENPCREGSEKLEEA